MSEPLFAECFLLVPDLAVGRRFYESALGLSPADENDHSVVDDIAGTAFKLQADYLADFSSRSTWTSRPCPAGRGGILRVEVGADPDDVHWRVAESEGCALFEPRTVDWLDGPMFLAEDPLGYTVEVR